ncbi:MULTISPECIES: ABC transporter permease subunit [unclassified Rhodococcus (in: high G+C Gram-positive bacteria)]|uniref:branched-chain amino acid ABC transporter ATP-binding protein/permease n=1 Tax=unclassified Rhodococcus (in: high G+C Gram-positive bacteria) TaxID=192944 RepID=UPI00163B0BAC|nr:MULTISPECIES: branched-chain amino acid ABC transporter ATP-binding protein/permease [unclassified Rhodococcus (in: high G+C Gram-positive bacteria)]MBC2639829.1 branched-chain amino acid ABC transporter ATP-binding protein/permease [Rhodococcus sp. 3A]MBC2895425.1 branched-chain amino acid ABC transporter ATP-binding protein/permease [Rhodococcus sp. 4CII]
MLVWRLIRSIPGWLFPLTIGLVVLFLPEFGLDFALSRQVQLACILALVVSGLNLSLGYAGELALGQAAMYAAGAYTAGLLSIAGYTDIVVQLIASGLVALAVGIVTGIPGLRLGSWSLAMTSFFLVLLVPDIIAVSGNVTGGRNGLSGIQPATLFGGVIDADRFYVVVVLVAIVWFAAVRNLVVSRHGIAFRTLKQSPVLASSVGISVFRMKLLGYAIGAFPAGLAGALFANIDMYVSPEAFGFTFATAVLAACILGGATSVYGAVVGAAIMQLGPNQSSEFQQYALVFYGGFLIVGGVLLSGGLAKAAKQVTARLDRKAGLTARGAPGHTDRSAMEPMWGQALVVDGISKAFGGNQALDDTSLRAEPGSVTALIGPNGSGKTTMLNMICGFYRPDSGRILVGDREVQGMTPERVAGVGVARTFQTPDIPDGVTVLEAVASGRYRTDRVSMLSTVLRLPRYRKVRAADLAEAERALDTVGLAHLRDETAASLPLGMRRLLEVARSVVARPRLLLLDEVASGLDEDEVERLADLIRRLGRAGCTIVLVEHNFRLVLALADTIVVLAQGRVIAAGPPSEIEHDPRVLSEYLGVVAEDTELAGEAT